MTLSTGIDYSGYLAKIELYDAFVLPSSVIELGTPDGIVNFKDFAVLANNWMAAPVLLGD